MTRIDKAYYAGVILAFAIYFTAVGIILYVAVHFIRKFW